MRVTAENIFKKGAPRGFTLVEILVVVVILGILAAIVIPYFTSSSQEARAAVLKDTLRSMRQQNMTFRVIHGDLSPGYDTNDASGTASEATYVAHMTLYSDDRGNTSATQSPVYKNGPYLSTIPTNPINNKNTILVIQNGAALPAAASDVYGWIFKPESQLFMSDAAGTDQNGANYFSY